MACVAWQTEWQDGPGVVETNQCRACRSVSLDERVFRRTGVVAVAARGQERAAGEQKVAPTAANTISETKRLMAAATGATVARREAKGNPGIVTACRWWSETLTQNADEAVSAAARLVTRS